MSSVKPEPAGRKREFSVDCGHTVIFDPPLPAVYDSVYCRRCQRFRIIMELLDPYRLRCAHCTLSRSYGADLLEAERAAGRHVSTNPQAVVTIKKGDEAVSTVAQDTGQMLLPGHQEEARARQQSQRSLTNFIRTLPK